MSNKFTLAPEDLQLFRHAVRAVKPIHYDCIEPVQFVPNINLLTTTTHSVFNKILLPNIDSTIQDIITYRRIGVQQSLFRKLRRGRFHIDAVLDLHGYTTNTAQEALITFIYKAHNNQLSCVHIIHGKGSSSTRTPVLKQKVNMWLRQLDAVLAFCSAKPIDGGNGALYVLLRRKT